MRYRCRQLVTYARVFKFQVTDKYPMAPATPLDKTCDARRGIVPWNPVKPDRIGGGNELGISVHPVRNSNVP